MVLMMKQFENFDNEKKTLSKMLTIYENLLENVLRKKLLY